MRTAFAIILAASLASGCGKNDDKPASGGGGAKPAAAPAGPSYDKIDQMVAAAKVSDDFMNVTMECGGLEIDAATSGKELAKDPTFQEHCKLAPTRARAKIVIAESTPDKMNTMCITAAMNLEELIEAGLAVDEMKALLGQVNTACGM
jgi:hypothetical protein